MTSLNFQNLHKKFFLRDKPTTALLDTCKKYNINSILISSLLLDEISGKLLSMEIISEFDAIREMHEIFKKKKNITSHLAAIFNKHKSAVSRIIRHSARNQIQPGRL